MPPDDEKGDSGFSSSKILVFSLRIIPANALEELKNWILDARCWILGGGLKDYLVSRIQEPAFSLFSLRLVRVSVSN